MLAEFPELDGFREEIQRFVADKVPA